MRQARRLLERLNANIRLLHVRVENVDFVGAEMWDYLEVRKMVRGCSGNIGRIMP